MCNSEGRLHCGLCSNYDRTLKYYHLQRQNVLAYLHNRINHRCHLASLLLLVICAAVGLQEAARQTDSNTRALRGARIAIPQICSCGLQNLWRQRCKSELHLQSQVSMALHEAVAQAGGCSCIRPREGTCPAGGLQRRQHSRCPPPQADFRCQRQGMRLVATAQPLCQLDQVRTRGCPALAERLPVWLNARPQVAKTLCVHIQQHYLTC